MLTALCAGLIFARVAHPRRAARALFVSDGACVARARADAPPTLSFRVLDTRADRMHGATVTAHLFRWAAEREGDRDATVARNSPQCVDWRVDELPLSCGGKPLPPGATLPPLLLPVTVEHVIDAASPLCGETLASLLASSAEIVVTLAAPSPRGDAVALRSYLASELHWGCAFAPAVARKGARWAVDVSAFHRVRPLAGAGSPEDVARDVLQGRRVVVDV